MNPSFSAFFQVCCKALIWIFANPSLSACYRFFRVPDSVWIRFRCAFSVTNFFTSFVYTASPLSRNVALSSSVRCFKHRPNLLDKCCGMNKDQSCPSQRISGLVLRITRTIILFFLVISCFEQPHGLRYTLDGRGWKMSPLRTRCLPLCALLWWLSFLLFCDMGVPHTM